MARPASTGADRWRSRRLWPVGLALAFACISRTAPARAEGPQVEVLLGQAVVRGRVEPSAPVTVTLRTGDDGSVVRAFARSDGQGNFKALLASQAGPFEPWAHNRIAAGDAIEVETVVGDSIFLRVPTLTAETNVDADTVSGRAPVGASLQVVALRALGQGAPQVLGQLETEAGLDGRYVANFASAAQAIDIEAPLFGRVTLTQPDGHRFVSMWGPLTAIVAIGDRRVSGRAAVGSLLEATLTDAEGRRIAIGKAVVGGDDQSSGIWTVDLQDAVGQPILVRSGDRLSLVAGADVQDLAVPPLRAALQVADGRIVGQTVPQGSVFLQLYSSSGTPLLERESTADGRGGFLVDAAGAGVALAYNSHIELTLTQGRNTFRSHEFYSGLTVDLDAADVLLQAQPGARLRATVHRGAAEMASASATGQGGRSVRLALRGPDGTRPTLRMDDALHVEGSDGTDLAMRLPALSLAVRWSEMAFSGRAEAGRDVTVWLRDIYVKHPRVGLQRMVLTTDEQGDFDGTLATFEPRAGRGITAQVGLDAGHQVFRGRVAPIANVQVGGPLVCGVTDPGGEVSVTLVDLGRVLASARGRGDDGGRYELELRDAAGAPIATRPGNAVTIAFGPIVTSTLTVPTLDATVDWAGRTVRARADGATALVVEPSAGCRTSDNLTGRIVDARPDGSFETFVSPEWMPPSLELARFDASGHRFYRVFWPLRIDAVIDTAEVRGSSAPGATLTVGYRPGAGAWVTTTATADASGQWAVLLPDGPDGVTRLRAGGQVTASGPDGGDGLTIAPLAFDFDAQQGIVGHAEPGGTVEITLAIPPALLDQPPPVTFSVTPGADGRFYASGPTRSRWSWSDVTGIVAALAMDGGHRVLSEWSSPARPVDPPHVFLPIAIRRR